MGAAVTTVLAAGLLQAPGQAAPETARRPSRRTGTVSSRSTSGSTTCSAG